MVASESDSEQLVVPSLSLQPSVISSSQAFFALVWVVNVVSKGANPVVQEPVPSPRSDLEARNQEEVVLPERTAQKEAEGPTLLVARHSHLALANSKKLPPHCESLVGGRTAVRSTANRCSNHCLGWSRRRWWLAVLLPYLHPYLTSEHAGAGAPVMKVSDRHDRLLDGRSRRCQYRLWQ